MKRLNQRGEAGSMLVPFIIVLVLFILSLIFGGWAFMGRNDYKNNVDAKIAEAVEIAEKTTSDKKDAEFAEKEKSPVKTYTGPAAYASVSLQYPKTWSAYVDESSSGSTIITSYFHPVVIPGLKDGTNYALRMQVLDSPYNSQVASYNTSIKNGKVKVSPFSPVKVPTAKGLRVEGEIFTKKQGILVMVPVRDKTVKIWTETTEFRGDLDNIVLPSLTFVP